MAVQTLSSTLKYSIKNTWNWCFVKINDTKSTIHDIKYNHHNDLTYMFQINLINGLCVLKTSILIFESNIHFVANLLATLLPTSSSLIADLSYFSVHMNRRTNTLRVIHD
jgi:hypothetical protein